MTSIGSLAARGMEDRYFMVCWMQVITGNVVFSGLSSCWHCYLTVTTTMNKYRHHHGAAPGCHIYCRAALPLIMKNFDDSSSATEDVPETADDEEYIFVPFMSQII